VILLKAEEFDGERMRPTDHPATPSFCDLIAPLTPADISALWSNRKLTFRRAVEPIRAPALLDWNTLRNSIETGVIPLEKCRITFGRRDVPPPLYSDDGRPNAAKVTQLAEQGASLIIKPLDAYLPAVKLVCQDARRQGIRVGRAGAIVTTGIGGALGLHFDPKDIIVLQLEGSKRWRVYGRPAADPGKWNAKQSPPDETAVFDDVLRPGDFLFMPAGYWHQCDNGPGRSLHIGLFVNRPTATAPQAH